MKRKIYSAIFIAGTVIWIVVVLALLDIVNGQDLGTWRWTSKTWVEQPNAVYAHIVSHWALSQIRYDRMGDLNRTEWQKVRSILIWHGIFSVGKECWDAIVPCEYFQKQGMGDMAFLGGDGFDYQGDILANMTGMVSWLAWHYRRDIWKFVKYKII